MLNKIKKYLGIAIICSTMFQVTVPVGFCVDRTKVKEKIKQNERNINDLKQKKAIQYKNQKNLNSQIKNVTKEIDKLTNKIKKLKTQTYSKQQKITNCVKKRNKLQEEVKNINLQIDQIEKKLEIIKKELLSFLKYAYMNGERNPLEVFLSSENFIDFANNSTYCAKLSQRAKDVLNSYSETINSISSMKNDKEKQIRNINETSTEIEKDVNNNTEKALEIERLRQKENEQYKTLNNFLDKNKRESKNITISIKNCEKMRKKLDEELRSSTEAIEKAIKKHGINSKTKNNEKSKNTAPQGNIKQSANHIFPVLGKSSISRGLSSRHHGVDIQTFGNANEVVASKAGKVIIATKGSKGNKLSGYGNVVVIYHGNGETTLYAHLSSILVSVGQNVEQGQVIGRVGNTGRVKGKTGMHLHHEVKINGRIVSQRYSNKT